MDIFTKEKRSWVMSRVKGSNTSIELLVFKHLRKRNIYFQKHYKKAPGSPDIAIPSRKLCVFIDGDFWHGRKFDKSNHKLNPFWENKILTNMKRDRRNKRKLKIAGWKILRVWESDLKKKTDWTLKKIEEHLSIK